MILLLMPTNLMLGTYKIFAILSYTLFNRGLASHATPSKDAAPLNLPSCLYRGFDRPIVVVRFTRYQN
ncbi:hypothetical protein ACX3P0_16400 [Mesorhizobium sp. A556]